MNDTIDKDENAEPQQLAIVEKYEGFIDYVYPIAQSMPRKHGVARDRFLFCLFAEIELLNAAGKSRQPSRLYAADANLQTLRFWLRFMAAPSRRIITPHQHRVASIRLAEVGKMLGAWIRGVKSRG